MKGYAPKGKTPVVRIESQKFKVNMLSVISKRGKLRFMLYKENMNAEKLIDFMGRLIRDVIKKVFLILDNLRVHHSKKFRNGLQSTRIKPKSPIFKLCKCRKTSQPHCHYIIKNVAVKVKMNVEDNLDSDIFYDF